MQLTPYNVYTRIFSKVCSGAKISEADFGVLRLGRFLKPFDQAGQVAVALAVQDAAKDAGLKSRAEFQTELGRLLG